MKAGIKMQLTWIGDEPTTATERSVLNNSTKFPLQFVLIQVVKTSRV
jgi:hypothetical protein